MSNMKLRDIFALQTSIVFVAGLFIEPIPPMLGFGPCGVGNSLGSGEHHRGWAQMTDLSEFARLADMIEGEGLFIRASVRPLIVAALRFRANASEEVIARALDNETIDDQASPTERMLFFSGAQRRRIESLVQASAVLAALEGRKP